MRHLTSRAILGHLPAALVPVAATAVILALRLPQATWPAYGSVYLCAVALVAATSGWKDAAVALVIGAILLDYFFVGPVDSFSLPTSDDWVVFLAFIMAGVLVAMAIEWRRASEKRLMIGIRLAQAQVELAEARAIRGFRENSGEALVDADKKSLKAGSPEWAGDLMEQIADALERSAGAMTQISESAPDGSAEQIREKAALIKEAAREVRTAVRRVGGGGPAAASADAPAYCQ